VREVKTCERSEEALQVVKNLLLVSNGVTAHDEAQHKIEEGAG
jgi:hypothetical protein